jgi:glycosyltransferase involved in cell wall biosynthesis
LKRSISSIQRQSIKDIEIIAVNDCSTDNSLKILKEMQKIDPRIIIINNKNNYGSLFSRAKGILNSKGEYLMCLDPDDEYRGKANLQCLYDTAKNLQVDFISFFIVLSSNKKKILQLSKFNKVLRQPEIFESAFKNNYLRDFYITNKFIKKELFKKAYHLFESKIYGEKWNYHEDNIWSILIYKYANSSVFINKKIYYYYNNNKDSDMNNRGSPLELKNLLYRNEMYKKIFKEKYEEKYLIAGFSEFIEASRSYIDILNKNIEIKNKFIKELNNFLKIFNLDDEMIKKTNDFLNKISNSCY